MFKRLKKVTKEIISIIYEDPLGWGAYVCLCFGFAFTSMTFNFGIGLELFSIGYILLLIFKNVRKD